MIMCRPRGLMVFAACVALMGGPVVAAGPSRPSPDPLASPNLVASPNPLALLNKGSLTAFIEKPLFDPSRTLPVVAPFVAVAPQIFKAPPEPAPALHLLGVIEGDNAMAIARGPDMKTLMLHSGDHLDNWLVVVLPNGLRLSKDGRTSDYGLFTTGTGKGVTPGPMPSLEPAAGRAPGLGMMSPIGPRAARNAHLQK